MSQSRTTSQKKSKKDAQQYVVDNYDSLLAEFRQLMQKEAAVGWASFVRLMSMVLHKGQLRGFRNVHGAAMYVDAFGDAINEPGWEKVDSCATPAQRDDIVDKHTPQLLLNLAVCYNGIKNNKHPICFKPRRVPPKIVAQFYAFVDLISDFCEHRVLNF